MSLAAAAMSFLVILPAELPDKTVLASLVMGSRYRPCFVFAGVAAAFTVHTAVAVAVGGLLGLLPRRPLEVAVSAGCAAGAVLVLRQRRGGTAGRVEARVTRTGFLAVAGTSFAVIMAAEFGDLTQILTANLAARYHDPVAVGIGSALALWCAAGLAIAGGRGLLRVIPIRLITLAGAAVMAVLAVVSLISAIRG